MATPSVLSSADGRAAARANEISRGERSTQQEKRVEESLESLEITDGKHPRRLHKGQKHPLVEEELTSSECSGNSDEISDSESAKARKLSSYEAYQDIERSAKAQVNAGGFIPKLTRSQAKAQHSKK